jgi:zinc transporter
MSELTQVKTGDEGLICAYQIKSGTSPLLTLEQATNLPEDEMVWFHFDHEHPKTEEWLTKHSGLDKTFVDSLLKDEVRPRYSELTDNQVLLVIRAINVNEGSKPEDMVSIRIWSDGKRIISLRHRPLMTVQEIRKEFEAGKGPSNVASFIQRVHKLIDARIETTIYALNNRLELAEDHHQETDELLDDEIADINIMAMKLKRHLTAQRDSLTRLRESTIDWISEKSTYWRELYHAYMIYVDELQEMVDRCKTLNDTQIQKLIESTNRTSYILSLVAAIFLPLSFVTGLLGINVGGIPGTESEWAFAVVCLIIIGFGVLEYLYFKFKNWL